VKEQDSFLRCNNQSNSGTHAACWIGLSSPLLLQKLRGAMRPFLHHSFQRCRRCDGWLNATRSALEFRNLSRFCYPFPPPLPPPASRATRRGQDIHYSGWLPDVPQAGALLHLDILFDYSVVVVVSCSLFMTCKYFNCYTMLVITIGPY